MRARRSHLASNIVLVLVVTAAVAAFLAPLWWTLIWSTWHTNAIFSFPPKFLPGPELASNFHNLQGSINIVRAFANSVGVTVVSMVGALAFCTLAGYVFAKMRFPGRSVLFGLVLATMVVPGQITVVPLFVTMVKLGWVNTYQGLILPGLVPAIGVFFMRTSAQQGIPDEILESARIDGAGELRIFGSIVLPLLRPSLGALSILLCASTWGALYWPLVVLRSQNMYTLPLALASLFGTASQPYDQMMVGSLMAVVPPLIFFFIMQRHFVRSITLSGLK